MSTHTHRPVHPAAPAHMRAQHAPQRRRPAPDADEVRLALRRLALLAAVSLLVALLTTAFAGIVVCVAGLAALAAHAAARPRQA